MNNKNHSLNLIHFNKRLIDSLNCIFKMPLTIISAPIGYGKTTAIRGYLYKTNAVVLWTNVYSNSTTDFWKMMCKELSIINSEVSSKLMKTGFPYDKDTRLEVIKTFSEIYFERETVLVVEDFHTVDENEATIFISSLAKKSFHNFHIVITTRNNLFNDDELLLGGYVNVIPSRVLSLDEIEIERFFKRYEIELTSKEITSVMSYTEGWISAINTIALTALHSDKFDFNELSSYDGELTASIMNFVYEPLPSEYKQFLCCICYISDISLEQAEYVWGEYSDNKSAKLILNYLVDHNIFTVFDKANNSYHMHNLLCKVIKNNFNKLDTSLKMQYLMKMGDWYAMKKKDCLAIRYYYKAGYYVGICNILSAGVTGIYKDSDIVMLVQCYKDWKAEMMEYCFNSMVPLAIKMYLNNYTEIYSSILSDVKKSIKRIKNYSQEDRDLFFTQYEILLSLSEHNDLAAIGTHIRNAYKICPKGKRVAPILDWVFGSPSVLFLYYHKTGTLNRLVDNYSNAMECYCLITNYDLSGTEYLLKAEINFNRCRIDRAEIYLYCALRISKKNDEDSLWIACCFLQARINFAKGDVQKAFEVLSEAKKQVQTSGLVKLEYTLDICESWLYLLSKQPENVSEWLHNKNIIKEKVFSPIIPLVYMIHGMILLENACYTEFISYSFDENNSDFIQSNIITTIYEKLCLSISYKNINLMDEAVIYLSEAIDFARTDDLYMPFVELESWLSDIFEVVTEEKLISFIAVVKENAKSINHIFSPALIQLTKREKEIANLVQNGLINKEIAEKLYISENTVKSALKQVFKKLGITSRKELVIKNHP